MQLKNLLAVSAIAGLASAANSTYQLPQVTTFVVIFMIIILFLSNYFLVQEGPHQH